MPHSDTFGSKTACVSPKHFAACYVLHRCQIPRHPPYALHSIILKLHRCPLFICQFTQRKFNQTKINNFTQQSKKLLHRKEVIQPHVPVRLPCYDFTPLTRHTLNSSSLAVKPLSSGTPGSGGVTGGVYKARERIHRNLADLRLLAIPAS